MSHKFKPLSTVALIIEHHGKYLIVEENNEDQDNKPVFSMPAGHVEAKESILEAALREGSEETGCEVKLLSLIGIYEYVKDYETIYRFCFEAKIDNVPENMQADDPDHEVKAVKWYSKDEIYKRKDEWRTRLVGINFDDYFAGKRLPLDVISTINTVSE